MEWFKRTTSWKKRRSYANEESSIFVKNNYDDVLSAPAPDVPKFKAPSGVMDYIEVFGGGSHVSSIPVIDHSPLDRPENVRSLKADNSKVFGSLGDENKAMAYDELLRKTENEGKNACDTARRRNQSFRESKQNHKRTVSEVHIPSVKTETYEGGSGRYGYQTNEKSNHVGPSSNSHETSSRFNPYECISDPDEDKNDKDSSPGFVSKRAVEQAKETIRRASETSVFKLGSKTEDKKIKTKNVRDKNKQGVTSISDKVATIFQNCKTVEVAEKYKENVKIGENRTKKFTYEEIEKNCTAFESIEKQACKTKISEKNLEHQKTILESEESEQDSTTVLESIEKPAYNHDVTKISEKILEHHKTVLESGQIEKDSTKKQADNYDVTKISEITLEHQKTILESGEIEKDDTLFDTIDEQGFNDDEIKITEQFLNQLENNYEEITETENQFGQGNTEESVNKLDSAASTGHENGKSVNSKINPMNIAEDIENDEGDYTVVEEIFWCVRSPETVSGKVSDTVEEREFEFDIPKSETLKKENENISVEESDWGEVEKRIREAFLNEINENQNVEEVESKRINEEQSKRMSKNLETDSRTIEVIRKERKLEKEKIAAERAIREARERAMTEAKEKAEKTKIEKAAAKVLRRAMSEARKNYEKAHAERVNKAASFEADKLSNERALKDQAWEKEKISRAKVDEMNKETAQRRKAKMESNQRIIERARKALEEKNMRDRLVEKEQAEKIKLAETLDAEIKRWANGKEGNLRALLSTLQLIIGPDSKWKPITLSEMVTDAAVKTAYRKATLYVHPDKLQQRGATIREKYICEKVFDLLKAAYSRL